MGACVEINCSGRGWSTDEIVSLYSGVVMDGWGQGQGYSTGRVGASAGRGGGEEARDGGGEPTTCSFKPGTLTGSLVPSWSSASLPADGDDSV